jgi:diphthamide biosynthesis methyltransferase
MCSQQACQQVVTMLLLYQFATRLSLTTCQQDVFATGLWQACQQVVTMLLLYQFATRLSLTTCQQDVFATSL